MNVGNDDDDGDYNEVSYMFNNWKMKDGKINGLPACSMIFDIFHKSFKRKTKSLPKMECKICTQNDLFKIWEKNSKIETDTEQERQRVEDST